MNRRTPFVTRTAAVLFAGVLALSSCSSDSGSDAGDDNDTTTTAADEATTTARNDDDPEGPDEPGDTTTTTEGGSSGTITEEDLESALPTAADLGSTWSLKDDDDDDDDDDPLGDAIEQQCPEVNALSDEDDDDGADDEEASVDFIDETFIEAGVELSTGAEEATEAELQDGIDAINGCGEIVVDDPETGITSTLSFDAEVFSDYGDQGVRAIGTLVLTSAEIPAPITVKLYIVSFRHGEIGVVVTGSDGIDEGAGQVNTINPPDVLALAELVDGNVSALVD